MDMSTFRSLGDDEEAAKKTRGRKCLKEEVGSL